MKKQLLIIMLFATVSIHLNSQETNEITDQRDGKKYSTVTIGNQQWMSKNLNYDNGESSWLYGDNTENAKIYGRLYKWKDANKLCPTEWHLPSDEEWDELVIYLGGPLAAGEKLKMSGESLWKSPNIANNTSGFSALPGGRRFDYGDYKNITKIATFWTSTKSTGDKVYCKGLRNKTAAVKSSDDFIASGHSVRCIKD